MRAGFTIKFCCVATLAFGFAPNLIASPLRNPKRLINERMVDLNPLFQWWTKHNGPRPLSAWVHVTGLVVGTNGFGWVVQGQIEKSSYHDGQTTPENPCADGQEKVILRNPPLADLADFELLRDRLDGLNAQRTQLAGQETEAANQLKSLQATHTRSRARAAEQKQLQQTETAAKNQLKLLDQAIQGTKSQMAVYASADHYTLDCFALDTGTEFAGMAVYEHGQVFK